MQRKVTLGNALFSWNPLAWTSLLIVLLIPSAFHAYATSATDIEVQVQKLALQLRCPVCQGLSVGDSPSELANEMRASIRQQLQQGKTPSEVLDYFVQRYGEWILLAPAKRGFNLVIWVLPFVLLPIGAVVIFVAARRWVRNASARESARQQPDPAYTERLQRELDSYR